MSYKTAEDLIAEAKARVREVNVADVIAAHGTPDAWVILDVREINETNLGRIEGAIVISRGRLEQNVEAAVPREAKLAVYCSSGNRSALAVDTLQLMGYANAANLAGGWKAWIAADGPVEA